MNEYKEVPHVLVGGPNDGAVIGVDTLNGGCPVELYWQGRILVHHDGAHRYQWTEEINYQGEDNGTQD